MMQQRWLLPMMGGALVLINLIFAWVTFPNLETNSLGESAASWSLPDPKLPSPTSIPDLMAKGFWGVVENEGHSAKGDDLLESVDEIEARQLRRRVKAIIGYSGGNQVLFEVEGKYERFSAGDTLPGTAWRLEKIEADRLELLEEGQPVRQLKLFSSSALIGTP
jgi:hypothetical protein